MVYAQFKSSGGLGEYAKLTLHDAESSANPPRAPPREDAVRKSNAKSLTRRIFTAGNACAGLSNSIGSLIDNPSSVSIHCSGVDVLHKRRLPTTGYRVHERCDDVFGFPPPCDCAILSPKNCVNPELPTTATGNSVMEDIGGVKEDISFEMIFNRPMVNNNKQCVTHQVDLAGNVLRRHVFWSLQF